MSNFQVGPETFVSLSFQVFDAEGEAASEPEIIATVFGMGQLLPGLEQAIEGRRAGETVDLVLPPEQAFGKRDASRILEVSRDEFPDQISAGDRFEVENDQGGLLVIHVLDVQDDHVVIDTNHPLADQAARFLIDIQEVRPATTTELDAALALMEEDQAYLSAERPEISVAQLVRPKH